MFHARAMIKSKKVNKLTSYNGQMDSIKLYIFIFKTLLCKLESLERIYIISPVVVE